MEGSGLQAGVKEKGGVGVSKTAKFSILNYKAPLKDHFSHRGWTDFGEQQYSVQHGLMQKGRGGCRQLHGLGFPCNVMYCI